MSGYVVPTLAEITTKLENGYAARLSSVSNLPVSTYKAEARVLGQTFNALYSYASHISNQIIASTADSENLKRHAAEFGILPKAAAKAFGTVSLKGTVGAIITIGNILQTSSGVYYKTTTETILTSTTATVDVEAIEAGASGNIEAGASLAFTKAIAGINSEASVVSISAGADEEIEASLLYRLLLHKQEPPHGGDKSDYEKWALSVAGVTRAWSAPQEAGVGTVTVRIMSDETTTNGIPTEELISNVAEYIETVRPATVKRIFVVAPIADPLNIIISDVSPSTETVKNAIKSEIADLIYREAEPSGKLLVSHIREAISIAKGEYNHVLISPTEDITPETGHIVTLGDIEWQTTSL